MCRGDFETGAPIVVGTDFMELNMTGFPEGCDSQLPSMASSPSVTIASPDLQTSTGKKIGNKPRTYKQASCPICKKLFFRKYEMNRHVNATHLKMRPFECELCPSKFSRVSHLKSHTEKIHHGRFDNQTPASKQVIEGADPLGWILIQRLFAMGNKKRQLLASENSKVLSSSRSRAFDRVLSTNALIFAADYNE
ncbi:hypothetical protein NDN08_007268 [Rhodosorus marinus]|uniref:C2H2-type domain-containing protein n=1 Tax=Rhodosorus marinus TaxID=101924 RepID=A0AAV8UJI1_9RHOD|nr:hypothetical protein NDN08_007268 [Rhodosorus marinus]